MELHRSVVLITGGAGGIGGALATAFRAAGAVVVAADLPGRGADIELDVTDADATARAIDRVIAEHGRLDVAVANAGIGIAGLVEHVADTDWGRSVDVNIRGVLHTVLPAYRSMVAQGSGHLVLMASLAGLAGTPLLAPYAMTKYAIVGLGDSLRPEAARHGVGVTVVCPGPIDTPLLDERSATPGVSVRRYLTHAGGPPLTPDKLAVAVVAGVASGRRLVAPGRAKFLWRLNRWVPRLVERETAKNMRNELAAANA